MKAGFATLALRNAWRRLRRLGTDAKGAIAIEYGLIAALIAVVIIGAIGSVGTNLAALPLPALIDAFTNALS